jgi:hypothetical protein
MREAIKEAIKINQVQPRAIKSKSSSSCDYRLIFDVCGEHEKARQIAPSLTVPAIQTLWGTVLIGVLRLARLTKHEGVVLEQLDLLHQGVKHRVICGLEGRVVPA